MSLPGSVGNSRERSGTVSTISNEEPGWLEVWVVKNSGWVSLGIIAVAFAMRLAYSDACYLNPDEAANFDSARPSTFLDAYQASLREAHPPLFILVLHGILFLGRTELILRLPSLVCGTAALWVTFAWIRRSLGEIAALAGLGFMAISPAAISASTEVRQYGLLLCLVSGALYATERTFRERSIIWAIVQGLFLLGALLTHYTAIVVIASLGLYVLLRSLSDSVPWRILFTFFVSQLVLTMVLVWLYFEHVRRVIPFGSGASMDYLRHYYYAASETPLGFAWRSFSGTFSYVVGTRRLPFLFMSTFLAGLAALLTGRTKTGGLMALLVISPFVLGFAAAVAQVFPFAGSRHQTYLLPFLTAGISAAFTYLKRGQAVKLLLLGAAIAPLWVTRAAPDNNPRTMPMSDMTAAIKYIGGMVPRGSPLFVDYESREVLRYYLARTESTLDRFRSEGGGEEQFGGYRVVVPRKYVSTFRSDEALTQVTDSALALGVPSGDPLWIVSTAWLQPSLASRLPGGGNRDAKEFGRISVIRVPAQKR